MKYSPTSLDLPASPVRTPIFDRSRAQSRKSYVGGATVNQKIISSTPESDKKVCPHCSQSFPKADFRSHKRNCLAKHNAQSGTLSLSCDKRCPHCKKKGPLEGYEKHRKTCFKAKKEARAASRQTTSRRPKVIPKVVCPYCALSFINDRFKEHLLKAHRDALQLKLKQLKSEAKEQTSKGAAQLSQLPREPVGPLSFFKQGTVCCARCKQEIAASILGHHYQTVHVTGRSRWNHHISKDNFEFIPSGHESLRECIEAHYRSMSRVWDPSPYNWDRLEPLYSLKPSAVSSGSKGFRGYVAFIFETSPKVILESPKSGNATYVLPSNWKSLVHLTKTELRREHSAVCHRIVHSKEWFRSVKHAIRAGKNGWRGSEG